MKNSENKKIIGILVFIGMFLALIPISIYTSNEKTKEIFVNHKEVIASKENQIIYLGRPTCSYCQMFQPVLTDLDEQYNFGYHYINTDEITKNQLLSILDEIGIQEEEFVTPYVVFMEDGVIKDRQVGYVEAEEFFLKLKTNGYVEGDYDSSDPINYIDFDQYEALLESKENNILVIGQTTCSYCIQTKPLLRSIIRSEEVVINYIEYDLLSSEERSIVSPFLDANIIPEGEDGWGTPTMIVVNDGKVIDVLAGAHSRDIYEMFLTRNNMIK
jgi:predicted bacteriocin transport accessory protein